MAIVAGWLVATVARAMRVTPQGRVLVLDVPEWPGNLAGQHLDLRLTAEDGYQAVRSYSIASFGDGTSVELAVDMLPDGEVSPYLVDDVEPGDMLEVRGPLGNFFVWRESQTEPVQLIAGGSGIVPLVSIARAHQAAADTRASPCCGWATPSKHTIFCAISGHFASCLQPNDLLTQRYESV